jgi:hypothetical protein
MSYTRQRRTNAELADIDDAIIEAVAADAPVTLRGVFYRVVSAGAIDKTELGYRTVGRELLKLRRDGRVSYADITDGTRWINKPTTWNDLDQMLEDAAASYRRALWHDTNAEVHVFTEKDAISGVILPVTQRWDVPLGVLRGYSSESFAWQVAQAIVDAPNTSPGHQAPSVYIYQLGDHDPSGVGAWEDFTGKVRGFVAEAYEAADPEDAELGWLHFERLAVTLDQIDEMGLPTRPTKRTDTRAAGFQGESVEVDAIPAPALREIVENAIIQHIDYSQYQLTRMAEQSERDILTRMVGRSWLTDDGPESP